ncbi:DoxX family protein, partial [Nonomuraea lactucae]|uniref:DoxX family protein n=1 Tax=Nonomuraea lactucae TaxID=2249762 RepID=UPI0013B3DA88
MKQALRDLAALVARLGVGGIFFANGWHKLEEGLNDTGTRFLEQGAPAPRAWATVTMLTELIGGALLIAGLLVSVMGLLLFVESLAVFLVAPPLNPISLNELVLLGVAALLLAVVGAGRVSVDHMVVIRRRESEAASEFAADTEADQVIASLRDPDRQPSDAASPYGPDAAGDPDGPDAVPDSGAPASEPRSPRGAKGARSGSPDASDAPAPGAGTGRKATAQRPRTGRGTSPADASAGTSPADASPDAARESSGRESAGRESSGRESSGRDASLEDTAPHPVPGRSGADPAAGDEPRLPAPGDT